MLAVASMMNRAAEFLRPAVRALGEFLVSEDFARILEEFKKVVERQLPLNWRGVDVHHYSMMKALLIDEGLPLAWVPPVGILERVLEASSPADRRAVIGRNWRTIAEACAEVLDGVGEKRLAEHVGFAKEASAALLSNNISASQALSANLMDTILRKEFDPAYRGVIVSQKTKFDFEDHGFRIAMVLGPIWVAHGQYSPSAGEAIPTRYSRHATAHGVSRRQYTRINATLSLMHVTALLKMLDVDFEWSAEHEAH